MLSFQSSRSDSGAGVAAPETAPLARAATRRYPLAEIVRGAGAELVVLEQDRREVPRAMSGRPRPETSTGMRRVAGQASSSARTKTVGRKPARPCLIVGYDGRESARAAASWAASTLPANGRLVLVYASRPLHAPASPLVSAEERRKLSQAFLDELALDGEQALLEVRAHAEVCDEDPVSALVEAAHRHHASGIVVGCEQHSRLRRAIGTVTSEVLLRSPVPVTVVPTTRSKNGTRQ